MTKKTALSVAIAAAATAGAVKGYQWLSERYSDLLPSTERYQLPRDTEPVMVQTSIGDFKLVAAGGYYGGTGIFVIPVYLVDEDAFMHQPRRTYALPGLAEPKVPQVTPELTAAFYEATEGQFHLELPPHTSSGGNSEAFALITAGTNYRAYAKHHGIELWESSDDNPERISQKEFDGIPAYSGYFKCSDAPTMRMAAHALRIIIEGSLLDRTKKDLRSIADGSLPEHTIRDLRKAKTTTEELAGYYKSLALTGYQACTVRVAEFRSKD